LIWVNSRQIYATPNYYVQQLFASNRGDAVLPVTLENVTTNQSGIQALYASAARDEAAGEIILKVVNPTEADQTVQVALNGANQVSATARATVLAGKPNDEDSMAQPEKVFPVQSELQNVSANFSAPFPAHSLSVLRIKTQ
jgi:alpha-N-arabinofuranosidase